MEFTIERAEPHFYAVAAKSGEKVIVTNPNTRHEQVLASKSLMRADINAALALTPSTKRY